MERTTASEATARATLATIMVVDAAGENSRENWRHERAEQVLNIAGTQWLFAETICLSVPIATHAAFASFGAPPSNLVRLRTPLRDKQSVGGGHSILQAKVGCRLRGWATRMLGIASIVLLLTVLLLVGTGPPPRAITSLRALTPLMRSAEARAPRLSEVGELTPPPPALRFF